MSEIEASKLVFPERPTCHDYAHMAHTVAMVWRPPDDLPACRTCSYCGSIHPADLLAVLAEGAVLHGSDWKYGWPHKFYVDGIPNPRAGEIVNIGTEGKGVPSGYQLTAEEAAAGWRLEQDDYYGSRIERAIFGPASPTLGGKWYNEHLLDDGYDAATRAHIIEQLARVAGIVFEVRAGKLYYRAPYAGYQRTS